MELSQIADFEAQLAEVEQEQRRLDKRYVDGALPEELLTEQSETLTRSQLNIEPSWTSPGR